MTSFISSSKIAIAVLYLAALAGVKFLLVDHYRPAGDYTPFNDAFRREIDEARPDLILIGNSLLYANVDRNLLDRRLSERLGRPVKTLFLTAGGSTSAWWYLVLKNQVAASDAAGIPVGVFFIGDTITNPELDFARRHLWQINTQLAGEEPVFFEKTAGKLRRAQSEAGWSLHREWFSLTLVRRWVKLVQFWRGERFDPKQVLEDRFNLERLDPLRLFGMEAPIVVPDAEKSRRWDFDTAVEKSFLPDMIAETKRFRFFLVEVHPQPGLSRPPEAEAYRSRLTDYLRARGVGYINLTEKPALDDPALYAVTDHLTARGRKINTELVVDELLGTGLFETR